MPSLFLLRAAELRAFFHRARATAATRFTSLLIEDCLFEAPLGGLFIDFCAAHVVTTTHNKNIGLFAAHQAA